MNKSKILLVFYIFAMFQMELLHSLDFLSYIDEMIVIWALCYIIRYLNDNKNYISLLLLIAVIVVYGIYCNYKAGYQTSLIPIISDVGNCFKVYITYIGASLYFRHNRSKRNYRKFINNASSFNYVFILLMILFYFLNQTVNLGMSPDTRFGIKSYAFIYGGASKYSFIFYLILPVLTLNYSEKRTKISKLFLFLSLALWLTTLRSKVLVFAIFYILLYSYTFILKKSFKFNLFTIGLGGIIAFLILEDQYHVYMDGEQSARYYFLTNGIKTLINYFPFGTGFGTFGTDVAAKYYSPLYYHYGMHQVYGLSPDEPRFAHDSYWPAIMGQFGAIGLVGFLLLLYLFFKDILISSRYNKTLKMVCTFFCITQLVASLSTSIFFHFMTVWQSLFIAFYINNFNETRITNRIRHI